MASSKLLESLLKSAWAADDHKELRLLVTGKTGEGKSTLVNGLLGMKVAVEDAGFERCTTQVTEYKAELHGVPVTVFDSPGLCYGTGDDDQCIADMKIKCQDLSLVLYCKNMTCSRLCYDEQRTIIKLTAAFGERFWEYTLLVLTFANKEDVLRRDEDEGPEPHWDDVDAWEELKKKRFAGRLKIWKEILHKFLIEEVGLKRDIVERIPVVPAGYHLISIRNKKPYRLPDRDDWLEEFWKTCSLQVKERRKAEERERQEEERKRKAEESARIDLLLDKKPLQSDLLWIFKSSAVHFKIIGTALDVTVGDLVPYPDATTNNLIKVFERWVDSSNDVTWRKILQVCKDYPEELGKAKADVEIFFLSDRAHKNYLK